MSNILIIKHGSLGDIVQISGVLRDIRESHQDNKVFILTTLQYTELLSKCPYLDGVLIDKRLPRWNIFYLIKLQRLLKKFKFTKVYDLQNSSRTSFYRRFLGISSNWSSSETTLEIGQKKKMFDNDPVLDRFKTQLEKSNVKINYTLKPDFSWAANNVDAIVNKFFGKKYVLLFPFCSPELPHKKWPYFNELVKIIKNNHSNLEVAIAPGPSEIEEAKKSLSTLILKNGYSVNLLELAGLIKKSSYVVANDTGPAHMAAHLGKPGKVIFGYHTTPKKVSIETENFKALIKKDLNLLSAKDVYSSIKDDLSLIN
jgi:ADP-heptose:LPS heptosyltransferase